MVMMVVAVNIDAGAVVVICSLVVEYVNDMYLTGGANDISVAWGVCQNIGCYMSAMWQTHKTLISLLALIYD